MRRPFLILLAFLALMPAAATRAETLVVASSTDRVVIEPLLAAFALRFPTITIDYREHDTLPLETGLRGGTLDPPPDLAIGSAVDRQFKLVNDGFAQRHRSDATARLPDWARFADEAFGISFEPLVIVANTDRVAKAPTSRAQLLEFVEREGIGPVATYDPLASGVGYLVANLDLATNSQFSTFISRLSRVGLATFANSARMLDEVDAGRVPIAFNVIGSYAAARQRAGARIRIVQPVDYTFALMRVAIIPKTARNPAAARLLLDFLLSDEGQTILARDCGLPAIQPLRGDQGPSRRTILEAAAGPVRVIGLDASLLALSDRLHEDAFRKLWQSLTNDRM